jgi:hypothetical protein
MRRYSLVLVFAAAVGAMAVGIATAAQAPSGHEAALRNLIDAAARGQVDPAVLTPELAVAVQPQLKIAQAEFTALGPLKSVSFQGINGGAEIYLTTFEHGALEWAFAVNADGRIANAMYRTPKPAP